MRAEAINGGLSRYRAARCKYSTSSGGGDCLVSTDDGYTFRFDGGAPGWQEAGEPASVETELKISFDGREVEAEIYNGPPLTSGRQKLLEGRPPGGLDRPYLPLGQRQGDALLGISGLVDEHGNIARLAIEAPNQGPPPAGEFNKQWVLCRQRLPVPAEPLSMQQA